MGANYGKAETPEPDMPDVSVLHPNNGLLFNDWYLPPEVVSHILTYFEPILTGRRVCRAWRDMIDTVVIREKILRDVPGANSSLFQHKDLKWDDFYLFYSRKPYMKNLLKNGSAEDQMDHWSKRPSRMFGTNGSKWIVENEPVGCDPFPAGARKCFTTSYDWCSAEQLINLGELGLTPSFMRHVRPNIHIEEWYAGRFDCGYIYSIKVSLLNSSLEVLDAFVFETTNHSSEWQKVEHVFCDYEGTVACILFHHKGKDTQFWAGNYGSKMTGGRVYISLPTGQAANSDL